MPLFAEAFAHWVMKVLAIVSHGILLSYCNFDSSYSNAFVGLLMISDVSDLVALRTTASGRVRSTLASSTIDTTVLGATGMWEHGSCHQGNLESDVHPQHQTAEHRLHPAKEHQAREHSAFSSSFTVRLAAPRDPLPHARRCFRHSRSSPHS